MKFLLSSIVTAGILLSHNANAQETDAQKESTQEPKKVKWVINCPQAAENHMPQCLVTQTMRSSENQKLFLSMSVNKAANDRLPTLQITVPLGIQLGSGLTLKAGDNDPVKVGYRTCIANGCITHANIADDMLETMQTAEEMEFNFTTLDQRVAKVSLNMQGISQAYNAMINRQNALRQKILDKQNENSE